VTKDARTVGVEEARAIAETFDRDLYGSIIPDLARTIVVQAEQMAAIHVVECSCKCSQART